MMCYSYPPTERKFVKDYRFAKNMSKNIGKHICKHW